MYLTRKKYTYFLVSNFLLLFLCSCNTTKYLEEDQLLLKKNSVKVIEADKIENKRSLKYELSRLYKQKPNNKFLRFIPREWFYYATQDDKDTTKFDRWQRRVLGEEPSIYDEKLTEATEKEIKTFLLYKGFYNAEVFADKDVNEKKKRIEVTYYAKPKLGYTIDSTAFFSRDTVIHSILQEISSETFLENGAPIDGEAFEDEKERITNYLRNSGYAYFYPNFIAPLKADSSDLKVSLQFEVLPFTDGSSHRRYKVGDVYVFPEFDPTMDSIEYRDSIHQGYIFKIDKPFKVKPEVISEAIYLKKGELFRQENYDKTNLQITNLGVHNFVTIRQEIDPENKNLLNFYIQLSNKKKLEIGIDFEMNYTSRSSLGNLLGIGISPSLRNRNTFKGAELLVSNFSAGVEVDPKDINSSEFWNTVELGFQTDLYYPRFVDYFSFWKLLNRIGTKRNISKGKVYETFKEKATSRVSVNLGYRSLIEFYDIRSITASYGFDVQPASNKRIIFNHFGMDYFGPTILLGFDTILQKNPFLERSFRPQLFTSLLFRDFNYIWTSKTNKYGESWYINTGVEMAGAEIWLANTLYNKFSLTPTTFNLFEDIDFSQYLKFEFDGRYLRRYTPEHSIAARFNIGIARPFGFTSDVPYVKQFYSGGPNSLRAWPARGIGPGSYNDTLTVDRQNRLRLYQTGDIKLEFNVEYRFDIMKVFSSVVEGAIFLDAGNIWTIKEDTARIGSQFLLKKRTDETGLLINDHFINQIAIGTGFGLRLDLSYFIIRFDLGYPLRFPYSGERENQWNNVFRRNLINPNFGLDYSF